jgi:hypothetical protein
MKMPRSVILFLAANPAGTSSLALDQECAAIERELKLTPAAMTSSFARSGR